MLVLSTVRIHTNHFYGGLGHAHGDRKIVAKLLTRPSPFITFSQMPQPIHSTSYRSFWPSMEAHKYGRPRTPLTRRCSSIWARVNMCNFVSRRGMYVHTYMPTENLKAKFPICTLGVICEKALGAVPPAGRGLGVAMPQAIHCEYQAPSECSAHITCVARSVMLVCCHSQDARIRHVNLCQAGVIHPTHGRIHNWGKWETFPTATLILEIYWGISPVKILFRPNIYPLTFDFLFFAHKIWPLPKNSGPNPRF